MSLKVFGLNGSKSFAEQVAKYLSIPLSQSIERSFEDTETYSRAEENVRGSDVYVVHSLYGDGDTHAGEKLTALAMFCGSLKDASAGRVTVVCPYLAYARQDRKTESRAPIGTKYVAKMLEAMGVDRLITMDVHNLAAFQNAFRIPTDNLEAKLLFVDFFANQKNLPENLVFLSPDSGGMSRTRLARTSLEKRLGRVNQISIAYLDKERLSGSAVKGDQIVGNIDGKSVIIIDDMIATGSTIKKARQAIEANNGTVYAVCATHGLFIGDATDNMDHIERIIVADTVPAFRLVGTPIENKLHMVGTAELFAKAIRRNHDGASVSELLED
jgi:ribose-phosphate pyrophosphokinase